MTFAITGPFQLKTDGPFGAHYVHICILLFTVKISIGSHRQMAECIGISMFGCPSILYAVVVLMSMSAHRASLLAAKAGVALLGPKYLVLTMVVVHD